MSDENKLMEALGRVESKLNDFEKSKGAAEKAAKEGEAAVQAELAAQRKQIQEVAALAQRGITSEQKDMGRELGLCIKGGYMKKTASEGTDAGGGYLVPDDVRAALMSVQNQYGLVRQTMTVMPMGSDVMKVPTDTFEDTDANTPVPVATSENAAISESTTAALNQVSLTAQKYATLTYIPQELLDDAVINYTGAFLLPKLGRKAAKIEDGVVFTAASTGLLNSSYCQVVNMGAGKTAFADMSVDNLQQLQDAVADDALANGGYIAHRSVFGLMRRLKGDDGQLLWAPAYASDPATMLGYSTKRGSIMPSTGSSAISTGFVIFGDVSLGCVVGERLQRRIVISDDFRFNYDQVAIRMTFRFAYATNADIGRAIAVLKTAAA